MAPTRLVVIGCGNVGVALIRQLMRRPPPCGLAGIAAVADSTSFVLSGAGMSDDLSDAVLHAVLDAKSSPTRRGLASLAQGGRGFSAADVRVLPLAAGWDALRAGAPALGHCITADCSAADDTGESLADLLAAGLGVVLANKKPLASGAALYGRFRAHWGRVRMESTVGAGLPVHAVLNRCLAAGDAPTRISGAFSGTLGFVMTGLGDGKRFSAVVREAKALGYTEPDPRDDLNGDDVGRKALILGRALGWPLSGLESVAIESLIPESLLALPLDDFMGQGLESLDAPMAARVAAAAAGGNALRYAATVEGGRCAAGLLESPLDSPLGRLRGTDNLAVFETAAFGPAPLVLQGRGAGAEVTAAGVLADCVELARDFGRG